jgi:hypothetical protein
MRSKRPSGGRKEAHPEELRREAMEYADRHGADAAGKKFKVPSGTVRSWIRREYVKAQKARIDESGLEAVMREGREIVARWEAKLARGESGPLEPRAEVAEVAEPVEEVSRHRDKPKLSRSARRRARKRERRQLREARESEQASGYAVNAPTKEPMRVSFDATGPTTVDDDSVQSRIGGRFPKGGGPA